MEPPTQLTGVFTGINTKENGRIDLLIRRAGMQFDDRVTMPMGRTQVPPYCVPGAQVTVPVFSKPYTNRNGKQGFYYDLIEGNGQPPPPVARQQQAAPPAQAHGNGHDPRGASIERQCAFKGAIEIVSSRQLPTMPEAEAMQLVALVRTLTDEFCNIIANVPSRAGVPAAARAESVGLTSPMSAPAAGTPAPTHGYGVLVTAEPSYHEKARDTGQMVKWWKIAFSDGSLASTFSESQASMALDAYRDQSPVNYEAAGEGFKRVIKTLDLCDPPIAEEQREMLPPGDVDIPF